MATTVEKGKSPKETPPFSPDQRRQEVLRNLLSGDAERATPETVEQLLALSEQNEKKVIDSVTAAATETLQNNAAATGTIDMLDPEGASKRQRDIESMTVTAKKEIAAALATETIEKVKTTDIHEALLNATNNPSEENIERLRALRGELKEEQRLMDDTEDQEMLESFIQPIEKLLEKITQQENAS